MLVNVLVQDASRLAQVWRVGKLEHSHAPICGSVVRPVQALLDLTAMFVSSLVLAVPISQQNRDSKATRLITRRRLNINDYLQGSAESNPLG